VKVIVLKKEEFVAKKTGVGYVNIHVLTDKSTVERIFLTKEKYDSFHVDESKFLSSEILNELIKNSQKVDIVYDSKGYVVEVL